MGCLPSKQIVIHLDIINKLQKEESYEEKRINAILQKSIETVTARDITYLKSCLDEFEKRSEMEKPILLMTNMNDFLQEIDGRTHLLQ